MPAEAAVLLAESLAAFTDADMAALFDNASQPMQLAALSGQEMRETEGALAPVGILIGASAVAARIAASPVTRYIVQSGGWGAAGGATNYTSSLISSGQSFDAGDLARDAAGGFVGGVVGGKLGKPAAVIVGNFTSGVTKGVFNRE